MERNPLGRFKAADISGNHFGRLEAVTISKRKKGRIYWLCHCSCGRNKIASYSNLINGSTRSCGCLQREAAASRARKHGMFGTRLYQTWVSMHKRCRGTSTRQQRRLYHDRGIKVCDEWSVFEPFMLWAKTHGYNDNLTIDRVDTNGNYDPNNCRWVSMIVQANNRRNNHMIEINGESKTISQWARKFGITHGAISERLRRGWSERDAVTQPLMRKGR